MYFWHWARCLSARKPKANDLRPLGQGHPKSSDPDQNAEVAQMMHGHELRERWDGEGDIPLQHSPPFVGAPALEVTHPFHIKLTPSMYLGPTCNHDLNCFLRLPHFTADAGTRQGIVHDMLDAMGDHEYYCSSYASKVEPQMEGLLHTLIDGVRRKEAEIEALREAGKDFTPHDIARKILHRLISCTNRRMHKGFPEMLTYLLRKPMEFSSHAFVYCLVEPMIRHAFSLAKNAGTKEDPVPVGPGNNSSHMVLNVKAFIQPSD